MSESEHHHHHHHSSDHTHSSEHHHREESYHRHEHSEASRSSSRSHSGHGSHRHHRHEFSTTGGYRMAGPADTTPITIAGMEDTARDDRLSLHVFDPNAHHSSDKEAVSRHNAHKKTAFRRKFRHNFLKILLYVVGILLAMLMLWMVIRVVGSPEYSSDANAVIGELTPQNNASEELPLS